MNQRSYPLPFPVRDATDLKRAVSYALRNHDGEARRYVCARARALGHTDMLPTGWGEAARSTAHSSRHSLDQQFQEKAAECGVSVAKLKTVYFRGVAEFNESKYDMGTPTMWGLARVQRFLNALEKGDAMLVDNDLVECEPVVDDLPGIELSVDTCAIIVDVMYGKGDLVSELLSPGEVLGIFVDDEIINVNGMLDGHPFTYTLDTVSGEHNLSVGDTVSV